MSEVPGRNWMGSQEAQTHKDHACLCSCAARCTYTRITIGSMHRDTVGSNGGGVSYERDPPVLVEAAHLTGEGRSVYRGNSLIQKYPLLGPYSRTIPRVM